VTAPLTLRPQPSSERLKIHRRAPGSTPTGSAKGSPWESRVDELSHATSSRYGFAGTT
jgi:hypothetical protein